MPLDQLRGLAVLLVVAAHVVPFLSPHPPGSWSALPWLWLSRIGGFGVDLFFVLSGFLVSGLLFNEHRAHGCIQLGRFLIRRGLKIYPSYYLFLAFTLLLSWLGGEPLAAKTWLASLTYLQNYLGVLPHAEHTWSLCVEEHFYLLAGLAIAWLARRSSGDGDPFRRAVGSALAGCAGTLALRLWHAHPGMELAPFHHFWPSHLRLDGLLWGVVLAYFHSFHHRRLTDFVRRRRRPLQVAAAVCAAPVALCAADLTSLRFMATIGLTTNAWCGALLVALAVAPATEAARRTSPWAPLLAVVGVTSYSCYLWHVPLALLVQRMARIVAPGWDRAAWSFALVSAGYVVAAVGLGALMTWVVEAPVLRWRDRWFPSRSAALPSADADRAERLAARRGLRRLQGVQAVRRLTPDELEQVAAWLLVVGDAAQAERARAAAGRRHLRRAGQASKTAARYRRPGPPVLELGSSLWYHGERLARQAWTGGAHPRRKNWALAALALAPACWLMGADNPLPLGLGAGARRRLVLESSNTTGTPAAPPGMVLIGAGTSSGGAFYIDRYEVSNAEYQEFVQDTGHRPPYGDPAQGAPYNGSWETCPPGLEHHPVVYVDWEDARAYAAWCGKRLPTEAEWAAAAGASDGGGSRSLLLDAAGADLAAAPTHEVGTTALDISPTGCYDMAGNVWEWVADRYRAGEGEPEPQLPTAGRCRVIRGGSSQFACVYAGNSSTRGMAESRSRQSWIGFRCAADLGSAARSEVGDADTTFTRSRLWRRASVAEAEQSWAIARALWEQYLQASPHDCAVRYHLAVCCAALDDWAAAKRQLSLVLGQRPDDDAAHLLMGKCYCELHVYTTAAQHLRRALVLQPGSAEALNWLQFAGQQAGGHEDMSSLPPTTLLARARSLADRQRTREAVVLLRSLCASQPDLARGEAAVLLGRTLYIDGRSREAAQWARRAAELRPDDPQAQLLQALVRYSLDQPEASAADTPEELKAAFAVPAPPLFPADDPTIRGLAQAETAGAGSARERAYALFQYVVRTIDYGYTQVSGGAPTPLDTLNLRRGVCIQFAELYVTLCRAVGIPARPVHAKGQNGGAHCYAEICLPGEGWTPVDCSRTRTRRREFFGWVMDELRPVSGQRRFWFGTPVATH